MAEEWPLKHERTLPFATSVLDALKEGRGVAIVTSNDPSLETQAHGAWLKIRLSRATPSGEPGTIVPGKSVSACGEDFGGGAKSRVIPQGLQPLGLSDHHKCHQAQGLQPLGERPITSRPKPERCRKQNNPLPPGITIVSLFLEKCCPLWRQNASYHIG